MRTKYATRAKQLQVKFQHDPEALENALNDLYAEQQQYEKGGNLTKELDKGIKVEMEHKRSLKYVKEYFKEKGKFPSAKQLAKSIAIDHIEDFKNVKDVANGTSYYDGLINNGLSDEVSKYVKGGNMNPSNVPDGTLENIRQLYNGEGLNSTSGLGSSNLIDLTDLMISGNNINKKLPKLDMYVPPRINIDLNSQPLGTLNNMIDSRVFKLDTNVQLSKNTNLGKQDDKKGGKKENFFNNNSDLLRFTPAIGSLMQGLEKVNPERVSLSRMSSPEKLNANETDLRQYDSLFDSAYNNQVGNIINTSGGSGATARANMLASLSQIASKKAEASSSINEQNKTRKLNADQFNISNQQNVNQINNTIANQENLTNLANNAAAEDYRRKSFENIANSLGNIGKENFYANSITKKTGYNSKGQKVDSDGNVVHKEGGRLNNRPNLINIIRGI